MQYRTFGKLDWKPSALGFGCMRLPVIDKDPGRIDEPEAMHMVRHAIDCGVNYVDTAYNYHREQSERFLGRALGDGYRQRVRLATKLPCWEVKRADDFDRLLNEQLARLNTEYVDFYLLHSLDGESWPKVRDHGVLPWAERALADGRIGHLGFSFHDRTEVLQEIVDASDLWAFCQIQYNYVDIEYQAGTRGLQYAASKGLAVVVMEPLRGGVLARNIPPAVQALWDSYQPGSGRSPTEPASTLSSGRSPTEPASALSSGRSPTEPASTLSSGRSPTEPVAVGHSRRTPADWALQWVWSQPEVSLVLSGMSTMEQVEENLVSADRSAVGTLTSEELALVDRVREAYRALCSIPCTSCKYCLPCPSGVDIPEVFYIYNDLLMYGDEARSQMFYGWLDEKTRADACIECGECVEKCPQGIEIPGWMKKVHEALGQR